MVTLPRNQVVSLIRKLVVTLGGISTEPFINEKEITAIAGKYLPVSECDEPLPEELYLSPNEWNLMFDQLDNYILIRVYNR